MAIVSAGAGYGLFDFLVALAIDFLILWLFYGFLVVDFLILLINCLFLILGLQVLFCSYWSYLIVYLFVKLIIDLIAIWALNWLFCLVLAIGSFSDFFIFGLFFRFFSD